MRLLLNDRYLTHFLFLLFLIPIPLFAQSGFLKIDNNKVKLRIVIDDTLTIMSNFQAIELEAGWHDVSILNPKRGTWNYNDSKTLVHIVAKDTTIIVPEFSIPLSIQTDPFDAQVYLNEKWLGTTPLHIDLSPSTSGTLFLRKELFLPISIPLDSINSGTINVSLPPNHHEQALFHQTFEQNRREYKRQKITTLSLMAVTLCSGFATAYFNDQAEQHYEKYLQTGNISQTDNHYRNAQKYDRYAAVSLGVFEVSFAFSFYFLIKTVVN